MKVAVRCLPMLLLLKLTVCAGQALQPVEVAKQIFGKTTYAVSERYATGEYEGRPNGHDLAPTATTQFLLLGQNDKRAVVAMTIQGEKGPMIDTYLHFQRDTIWKLCAFRALAMTGMIEKAKQELEQMTPKQVDELIARAAKSKDKQYEAIRSRADYEFELGNCSLVLQSDAQLIAYFRQNKAAFEQVRDGALAEVPTTGRQDVRGIPVGSANRSTYRQLFISSVRAEQATSGKRLNFLIGGIIDNTVGYYYVTDKQAVPEMSPDDIIMVREIGDGWYLYKTT